MLLRSEAGFRDVIIKVVVASLIKVQLDSDKFVLLLFFFHIAKAVEIALHFTLYYTFLCRINNNKIIIACKKKK